MLSRSFTPFPPSLLQLQHPSYLPPFLLCGIHHPHVTVLPSGLMVPVFSLKGLLQMWKISIMTIVRPQLTAFSGFPKGALSLCHISSLTSFWISLDHLPRITFLPPEHQSTRLALLWWIIWMQTSFSHYAIFFFFLLRVWSISMYIEEYNSYCCYQ